ncbi:MAG: DUF4349 domain-containing protein, partial [Nanoarchaeota archaeon]
AVYQEKAYYPYPSENFAPGVEERKITTTATISTEIKRGTFDESESKLKGILSSSGSYLLNENAQKYGTGRKAYRQGSYQIKVESGKYDSVISQLKEIGELSSFSQNAEDVTGSYTDAEIELQAEKERLARYMSMYEEAKDVADKIELNDRIFEQERIIKYLEDSIKNIGQRADYSAIYFTMSEKQSEYANIAFVKFSELVRNLIGSFNALIGLLFTLAPWAIAVLILRFIWKIFKKKK